MKKELLFTTSISTDCDLCHTAISPAKSKGCETTQGCLKAAESFTPAAQGIQGMALPHIPELPSLTFGLQKAGYLAFNTQYEVPKSMAPIHNNSQAQLHQTTLAEASACEKAANQLFSAFTNALQQQAESKGYFHQPFLVRYAMRLSDGTHIMPSPPVLMLPWALRPCLGIASVTDNGDKTNVVTLRNDTTPYFRLRCSINADTTVIWSNIATAIDIFVTKPICTFQTFDHSTIGISRYSTESEYVGQWSESNDTYCNHTTQELGICNLDSWHINPNPSLWSEIEKANDFYQIASIDISECYARSFFDLPIISTHPDDIAKGLRLQANDWSHCHLNPNVITTIDNKVLAAGGNFTIPRPLPLESTIAATTKSASHIPTTITVWVRTNDGLIHKNLAYDTTIDMERTRIHYIYYPFPSARYLQIEQGSNKWILPMKKHSALDGSYCLIDNNADHQQASREEFVEIESQQETIPCENAIFMSTDDKGYNMHWAGQLGHHKITGIATALKSMSQGQFGQYQLYAFATTGIHAINIAKGLVSDSQLISQLSCSSAGHIVATPKGVVLLSAGALWLISGSKCDQLIDCRKAGFSDLDDVNSLYLDADNQRIILWRDNTDENIFYSLESKSCGILPVLGSRHFEFCSHPFAMPVDKRGKLLRSIRLNGCFDPGKISMTVYGSNNLNNWSWIGTSARGNICPIVGSPYAYYRIAITGTLDEGQLLHSVTISY